jgi:hypothetical protein
MVTHGIGISRHRESDAAMAMRWYQDWTGTASHSCLGPISSWTRT